MLRWRVHTATFAKLTAVLERQHLAITLAQIRRAGCDPELTRREVDAGRWQRISRGTFLASADPPTDLQQAWCAQLAGGEGSVVTGAVACRIAGIADVPSYLPVAVLVGANRPRDEDGVHFLRTARPPAPVLRGGLWLAPPARAVVDAARAARSLRDVRALVTAALRARHCTHEELVGELAHSPRRGSGHSRRALQDWADGARSAPEAEVADWLREQVRARRMPPFLLNPLVYDGSELLGAVDVHVPGCALGGEVDSARHHAGVDDLDATLLRHARFAAAGVHLEHVTPTRFRRAPELWAAGFAMRAADRRRGGDPVRLRIEPAGPVQPVPGRRRRSPNP